MWQPPSLSLRWGDYLEPDADDDTKLVTMALAAYQGRLVTRRSAVQQLQRTFAIENVDQFMDALEKEDGEREAKALKMQQQAGPPDGGATPNRASKPNDTENDNE